MYVFIRTPPTVVVRLSPNLVRILDFTQGWFLSMWHVTLFRNEKLLLHKQGVKIAVFRHCSNKVLLNMNTLYNKNP